MTVNATVFVVDDDHAALKSLAALVRSRGLKCQTFDSAESFLHTFNPDAAGAVITDLRMDGMNGVELQERLTQRGSLLPVIVVSGHADVPVTVKLMAGGALTLLQKPYDEHDLLEAIDAALHANARSRKRAARMLEIGNRLETLSDIEEQILRLMLEGQQNKVIAGEIRSSLRTIDRRRRSVLDKMQVDSVAELAQMVSEYQAFREQESPGIRARAVI